MNICSYAFFRNSNSHYEHPNCGEARGRVFVNYLRLIVRAHHAVWGESWQLRIAHDTAVTKFPYFEALEHMAREGLLKLVHFGESATLCGLGGMLERLRPAWEPGVEYVACRDVDSVPMPRDRRAVEEFISTGKAAHVIHDASAHSGLMGGTLCVRAPRFRELIACSSLERFIERGVNGGLDFNQHGTDQHLLNKHWPVLKEQLLIHELHHVVGDMPEAEVRTRIDMPTPPDIHPEVAAFGDTFSRVIGGCSDVEAPHAFYRKLAADVSQGPHPTLAALRMIEVCEVRARVNA